MRRLVAALGVLATLSVLAAAVLAVVHRPADRTVLEDRQWLRAYGVEVAVPAQRWRLAGDSEAIGYGSGATLTAPAVLDEGFCPSSRSSSRAFVGVLPPTSGAVESVVARVAGAWASAIQGSRARTVAVTGSRSDLDVPVGSGPCNPNQVHLTVFGRRTPAGVVTAVLVRDVGAPGDLSASAAEAIVQSLRSRT